MKYLENFSQPASLSPVFNVSKYVRISPFDLGGQSFPNIYRSLESDQEFIHINWGQKEHLHIRCFCKCWIYSEWFEQLVGYGLSMQERGYNASQYHSRNLSGADSSMMMSAFTLIPLQCVFGCIHSINKGVIIVM